MILKPSEISKGTEKVLAEELPQYLDQVKLPCPFDTHHPHIPAPAGWDIAVP